MHDSVARIKRKANSSLFFVNVFIELAIRPAEESPLVEIPDLGDLISLPSLSVQGRKIIPIIREEEAQQRWKSKGTVGKGKIV